MKNLKLQYKIYTENGTLKIKCEEEFASIFNCVQFKALLKKIEAMLGNTLPMAADIVSLYIGEIAVGAVDDEGEAEVEQTLKIISNTEIFSNEICEKLNHLVMLDIFEKMDI